MIRALLCVVLFIGVVNYSYSQIPGAISYQGIIINPTTKETVADGVHIVKFRFYDAPEAGNFKWETTSIQVTTFKGLFTTIIPVPANATWDQQLYVDVIADGTELGRVRLTTVPYAFNAQQADVAKSMNAAGLTGTIVDQRLTEHLQDLADGSLSGSKVGTGIDAGNITSGTFDGSRVGTGIKAANITDASAGVIPNDMLDEDLQDLADGSLSAAKIEELSASKFTSGTFDPARIPDLDAAKITAGTLPVSRGGTGVTTASDGQLLIGNGTGFTAATLTEGAGISITNSPGGITISSAGGGGTGTVTNVSASAPLSVSNPTTAPAISMAQATTSESGYLSATDWNSFSNKAGSASNGLTMTGTNIALGGTLTGSTDIASGGFNLSLSGTGRLGIGTASPGSILHLDKSGDENHIRFTEGGTLRGIIGISDGTLTANDVDNDMVIRSQTNLLLTTGGIQERLAISTSGNVGIGTTTPQNLLHMDKSGNGNYIRFTEAGTLRGVIGISSGGNNIIVGDTDNDFVVKSEFNLLFGANGLEKMRLSTAGNLGIGATTPQNRLDVEGGAVIGATYSGTNTAPTNGLLVQGNVGIGTTTANAPLQFASVATGRKVVLYETANNDHQFYGFGMNGSILRYQTSSTSADHTFYAGTSSTTSNELMRITGTGNVGIGTPTPASLLNLDKTSSGNYVRFSESGTSRGFIGIAAGTNDLIAGDVDNDMVVRSQSNLLFGAGGSERMRLSSSGNLGIGTTTPANKLDVEGGAVIGATYSGTNTAPANGLLVEGNVGLGAATTPLSMLHLDKTGNGNYIHFSEGGTLRGLIGISGSSTNLIGSDADNDMVVRSQNSNLLLSTSATERMRISTAGNVGIGTPTPVNKLDVEGGVVIGATYSGTNTAPADGLLVEGNVGIGTASPGSLLALDRAGSGNYIRFGEAGTLRGSIGVSGSNDDLVGGDVDNDFVLRSQTNMLFASGGQERMRLSSGGSVGVGTTSPQYRLSIYASGTSGANTRPISIEQDYSGVSTQYGLTIDMTSATGTAAKYGIDIDIDGTAGSSGQMYGISNSVGGDGTGSRHGILNTVAIGDGTSTGTAYGITGYVDNAGSGEARGLFVNVGKPNTLIGGDVFGVYVETDNDGPGDSYQFYGNSTLSTGTGTKYGIYAIGETLNYFYGKVGIGQNDLGTIGSHKVYIQGTGHITGGVWSTSDVRYKKNFTRLTNTLSKIKQLEGYSYEWKRDENPDKEFAEGVHIGFKAQEVEKYFPELISTDGTGYKSMNYAGMTPVLLEAIKEQQDQIEQLQATVRQQQNEMQQQSTEVIELKKQLAQYESLSAQVAELQELIKQQPQHTGRAPQGEE